MTHSRARRRRWVNPLESDRTNDRRPAEDRQGTSASPRQNPDRNAFASHCGSSRDDLIQRSVSPCGMSRTRSTSTGRHGLGKALGSLRRSVNLMSAHERRPTRDQKGRKMIPPKIRANDSRQPGQAASCGLRCVAQPRRDPPAGSMLALDLDVPGRAARRGRGGRARWISRFTASPGRWAWRSRGTGSRWGRDR